jgi:hypothetical protein
MNGLWAEGSFLSRRAYPSGNVYRRSYANRLVAATADAHRMRPSSRKRSATGFACTAMTKKWCWSIPGSIGGP